MMLKYFKKYKNSSKLFLTFNFQAIKKLKTLQRFPFEHFPFLSDDGTAECRLSGQLDRSSAKLAVIKCVFFWVGSWDDD